jgi:hypothetical protein
MLKYKNKNRIVVCAVARVGRQRFHLYYLSPAPTPHTRRTDESGRFTPIVLGFFSRSFGSLTPFLFE